MKNLKISLWALTAAFIGCFFIACDDDSPTPTPPVTETEWKRNAENPVYRDIIPNANYQSASDGHVFFAEDGSLNMIYSGDVNDNSSIKLAKGSTWTDWEADEPLLFEAGAAGLDVSKETAFYRKANNGKHQIYYIGYADEDTYQAQIFLAEADALEGPYVQLEQPVVPRGELAGQSVYCITSPSVVEHEGTLYIVFIGWDASPDEVTTVWMIGATSTDEGHTWSDFQIVDTPIGMEGQLTKKPDGSFIAVRTGEYNDDEEAIFYATADHPFGPWETSEEPILTKAGAPLEKHEIIAPQITIDPNTGEEYLYYTGADYQIGWWMMLAQKE